MKTCSKCKKEKAVGEFYRHPSGKDGHMSVCKACHTINSRKNYKANEEDRREYGRKYRKEHKEKGREYAQKYREENKEKVRESQSKTGRKHRFSIALRQSRKAARNGGYAPCNAAVEELKAMFNGRCGICGVPELELTRQLCVDHDHETGDFRGFLCCKCNRLLGCARDSENILIDALHFLMNCKQKQK